MNSRNIPLIAAMAVFGLVFLISTFSKSPSGTQPGSTNAEGGGGNTAVAAANPSDTASSSTPQASSQAHSSDFFSSILPSGLMKKRAEIPQIFGVDGPVTMDQVPKGRFRRELLALNDSARQAALDKLGQFKVPVIDLNSLHANEDGSLYYACFPKFEGPTVLPPEATNPSQSKVPISSPPARNSRPDATHTLFLDFSGVGFPNTTLKPLPYDLDGDIKTFNEYEQAQIVEVWRRVSEDFKPFNINVTTVKPEDLRTNYPLIGHVVITKNTDADGKAMPSASAGGVATLGIFAMSYAYYNNAGFTAANIAEVVSHEAGHNFSLLHDGQDKGKEYYTGHGNDQQSWGPIMGASYGKDFTQWTTGNYSYSYSDGNWTTANASYTKGNNAENDIFAIGRRLGYAADDAPNTVNATITANSTKIPTSAGKFSTKEYVIGLRSIAGTFDGDFAPDDVDVFPIDVDASTLDVTVSSFKIPSSSTSGSNLGLKVEILSSNGSVIKAVNSGRNLVRAVGENLVPGTYYISVSGAGFGNSTATSPLGFPREASLGTYSISGTISGASSGGNNTITDPALLLASSTALSSLSLSSGVLSPSPAYRYKVSSNGSVPANQAVSLAFDANPANPAANLISLAVRPTPTPGPSASPTPTTPAPLLSVSHLITRTWGSGMQGQLFVRNSTRNDISNWSLAFDYPSAITSVGTLKPSGLVTTHAGSGMRSPTDGNPSVAGFNRPQGIALQNDGTIYVADRLNNRIRKISASGNVTTLAGSGYGFADGQGSAASFKRPHGVAVDDSGTVYVADTHNFRIRKITASGNVTTLAGSGNASFSDGNGTAASFRDPSGVAVDGNGTVYVADKNNHRIRKITPTGNVTTLAGSGNDSFSDGNGTAASFCWPSGVAVDGNGTVYVADTSNNRIRKITPTGNVTTLAGSGFSGLVDGQGTAASFSNPSGLAVDGNGTVYVSDTGNNRIRKITPSGMVTTLAGPVTPGSPDGQIFSANFSSPTGVAVDGNGTVYVADSENNVISKTISSGNVTFSREVTAREFVATVPNEAASITLNWTTENPAATSQVKLNSANAPSFNGTGNFSLSPGENTIMLEVTSADTTAKGYHRFTITRQASPPDPGTQLASLSFGAGNWTQAFSANRTNYDITLPNGNSTVSINANKLAAGGKIEARVGNGVFFPLVSGRRSAIITLPVGATTIEARVTSANGTSSSYFFNLNRTATTPALSNLLVRWNATNLSTTPSSFSSNTTTYNATVANSVSAVTLTPTVSERNSSIAVRVGSGDFVNVTSGNPGSPLGLTANATNTVEVRVLSDNNTTNRTYSLNITRLAAPVTSPVGIVSLNGTTFNGTIDARSTSAAFQLGTSSAFGTALPVSFIQGNGSASVSIATGALLPSTQYFYRLTSQYGNFTDFGETLSFITPASASSANLTQVRLTGASVTGGTFTEFAYPALNIGNGTAFQGFLSYGVAGSRIFGGVWTTINGTTRLAAGIGASAPDNAVFSGIGEPILDDVGRMTFTGFLRVGFGGVRSNTSAGIWQVAANGTTSKIVRAGESATGATGTVFSSFNKLVAGNGGIAFTATLASGSSTVNSTNSTGLWAQNSAGSLVLVARTGASPTSTLRNFTIFNAETGQNSQSRHFNESGDLVLTATFGNGTAGIYRATKTSNFTLNASTLVAAIGSAVPGVTGGNFTSLGNPIINNAGDIAFRATFSGNGVSSGNNTGIFRYSSNGTGALIVRTGVATGNQTFQSLSAPLLNNAKDIALTGALATGGNVTSSNANGIWTISSNGTLTKIFRSGDSAPGVVGSTFASFSQLAFPANGGIIFAATLATGSGGVSTTNNQGLWAASSTGANPTLIVRTGNSLPVGGGVKTISSFDFFSASSVTDGVGRTINSDGDIILKLNFTDKSSGLFRYDAP